MVTCIIRSSHVNNIGPFEKAVRSFFRDNYEMVLEDCVRFVVETMWSLLVWGCQEQSSPVQNTLVSLASSFYDVAKVVWQDPVWPTCSSSLLMASHLQLAVCVWSKQWCGFSKLTSKLIFHSISANTSLLLFLNVDLLTTARVKQKDNFPVGMD